MKRYTILLEGSEDPGEGFSAYCPDLPGCVAAAPTEKETLDLMFEAVEFHLEGLALHGQPIPEPLTRAVEIAVRLPEALARAA